MDSKRVLIVEDEAITSMRIKSALEEMGYRVTSTAFSGEEAIEKAETDSPDLILMDITLSGKIDGIEAAGHIKSRFNIPVLYLTAHSDEKNIRRIKSTQPFGYIIKPFNDQELHFAIEIALLKFEMECRLKINEATLRNHKLTLEELVKERTSELTSAVELLKDEIVHRKKTEEDLRQSEKRFRQLFNYMSSGVAVYEAVDDGNDFVFTDFNRSGESIDKVKKEDVIGKRVTEVFPGVKDLGLLDVFRSVWKSGRPQHLPIALYKDNRINGWRENHIYKLPTDEIVAVYNDVTEQKQAREEAIRASHLASIGELAAGVAHEINNPINGIINYAQLLFNKNREGSQEHDVAERIIREGDRIADIVKNLLSFARERSSKKAQVNISDILIDSMALIRTQIKKDGIRLLTNIPPDLPLIEAHPQHIEQVFLNIISNARYALNEKYPETDDSKVLEIRAEEVGTDNGKVVKIAFHDKGTGIKEKIIEKVLNPFFSTKPDDKGTGLGLSISHGIISDHGGKLKIKSVANKFTTVTIEIPAMK